MHHFFNSSAMLYILAVLLVLVFFLPDLIGPLPAIVIGSLVIGFALFVYNRWSRSGGVDERGASDEPPDDEARR